jgi:hypothetical protein
LRETLKIWGVFANKVDLQEKRQPGFEKVQKPSKDRLAYEAVRAAIEAQHPAIKQRIV